MGQLLSEKIFMEDRDSGAPNQTADPSMICLAVYSMNWEDLSGLSFRCRIAFGAKDFLADPRAEGDTRIMLRDNASCIVRVLDESLNCFQLPTNDQTGHEQLIIDQSNGGGVVVRAIKAVDNETYARWCRAIYKNDWNASIVLTRPNNRSVAFHEYQPEC